MYVLNIKNDDVVGLISLSTNGSQTITRIYANGTGSKDSLGVVFDSYGSDNMFIPFYLLFVGISILVENLHIQKKLLLYHKTFCLALEKRFDASMYMFALITNILH